MKKLFRKPLSLVLAVLMILSALSVSLVNIEINAKAYETNNTQSTDSDNPYGLTENIKDGAILHAWSWSFNTIKENLQRIAEAGFTSVQTSPINECIVGEGGGMQLFGNGKWYYHYQPTRYAIGNYQLGTQEEFEALCSEADKYGIKIIVDAVVNHTTGTTSAISSEITNLPGGAFHTRFSINDYSNRYQCTQGELLGLRDLNTQNENVQQMVLNYLKSCVAAGADGFRYDAAKHIELPDDEPYNGNDFASDFWPVVLDNGSEFQYGEILQGGGSRIADYAQIMRVTASSFGETLRNAVLNNRFSAGSMSNYRSEGASADRLVTWVESHDNYCNDGSWAKLDNQEIRQAWAVISASGDTTPLFFSRPDGSSTTNQWGKNRIGMAGDDNFCHPEVAAVNRFRNAMVGLPKKLSNPTGDSSVLMIERGSAGAVIINLSDSDVTLNCSTNVANGTYNDQAAGSVFTVSDGKLQGTVKAGAVAVVYNSKFVKLPTVSISQNGGSFRGTLTLTLTAQNTTKSTYKINNGATVDFVSGDTITIGKNMAVNSSVTITLYGENVDGNVTEEFTFTKLPTPSIEGETVVYFDNSEYNWGSKYVYVYYYDSNNKVVENASWPGIAMTDLGSNMYGYVLDESWNYNIAYVIFNNGNNGIQFPDGEGYNIKKGESKIFNESGLSDYIVEPSITRLKGDVDNDGEVTVKDATMIQLFLANLYDGNNQPYIDVDDSEQVYAADFDDDNDINVRDVTMIQLFIANLL
ncbi:MAG: starch-binding protein [Ruminococcus sp.]|nr:starch-binding protein [Ruminococcus sp.]